MLRFKIKDIFLISKHSLSETLFVIGVTLAFYESLHPWILWSLGAYAYILSAICLISYVLISKTLIIEPEYNKGHILLFCTYTILSVYLFFVSPSVTFTHFISVAILIIIFYIIFKADGTLLKKTLEVISKSMACILIVSIFGFFLYIIGFSLPYSSVTFGDDLYSFLNYYFFLTSDSSSLILIPRFQSIFLEPSHMAIAATFLLMTECGNWKRWYNIILLISIIISFSLEAYVLLLCLYFLNKWIQRKHFIRNLFISISIFILIIIGSFFYNDGDNMFNSLIVMRMEVDDGDLAGNNRTTDYFDAEYESFLNSPDVWLGRDMDGSFGNSGYKVFIYENGFIGIILLVLFYGPLLYNRNNTRAAITALTLTMIHFIVRAHIMWESCILPMYYMAQWYQYIPTNIKKREVEEDGCG